MGSFLGNVPHSASQTFLVSGEQLFLYLTGDSSLPMVFLTTWLIPEAFQAFASFLSASSLPVVKFKSCIRRFKISSSLLRLSKMICWSPLNLSPFLRLAPSVPFTYCVRFQESLTCGIPLGVFLSTDHFVLISVTLCCQLGGFGIFWISLPMSCCAATMVASFFPGPLPLIG